MGTEGLPLQAAPPGAGAVGAARRGEAASDWLLAAPLPARLNFTNIHDIGGVHE